MFNKARLKLTAWYLLIIMFISIFFSFGIYKALTHEVERFAKRQRDRIEFQFQNSNPPPPQIIIDPDLIIEVKQRVLLMLTQINLFIFVVAGTLGYFLAGRTLKPIADMVEEQNQFISDASHELRTPLTALKTSMEVNLRDQSLTLENVKNIIKNNIDQVNKLQLLSDNLLELASYQNSNNQKYFKVIEINKIINEVIKKLTPLAQKKQILIKKNLIEAKVNGNKDSLVNLFTLLLDNAIKYSSLQDKIIISLAKTDKLIIFTIKDYGIGISKKDLPHIFDRFFRADLARSKTHINGYGLGLAIAKKIVQDHKGNITVTSTLAKGTTFQVTFSLIK